MKSITFHCEVITPMFLAGADGQTPELRPPSIKGAMRFWWRAMNGDLVTKINGKWDYSKLKEEEAKLFGGSYKEEGKEVSKRSNLNITISKKKKIKTAQISLTPHHRVEYCSANKQNCFNFNKNTKTCVKAKKQTGVFWEFDLLLFFNEFAIKEQDLIKLVKVMFLLGGLGKRSRRGFGSIVLKHDKWEWFNNIDEVEKFISAINTNNNVNYPVIKDVRIGKKPYSNYEDLLIKIGEQTHSNSFKPNNEKINRYASPEYVSVVKLYNDYYPIVTSLTFELSNLRNENFERFKENILK